ncbi:MAG: hypothetical protein NTX04_03620, partial [Verrucomicrobia bacterium]|nr:hypothetical protein [Verrucomicrobiota bacterium]
TIFSDALANRWGKTIAGDFCGAPVGRSLLEGGDLIIEASLTLRSLAVRCNGLCRSLFMSKSGARGVFGLKRGWMHAGIFIS